MMSKWTSRDWDNSFESFQGILEALGLAHCVVKLTKYHKPAANLDLGHSDVQMDVKSYNA